MIEPLPLDFTMPLPNDLSPLMLCALGLMGWALLTILTSALFQYVAASDVETPQMNESELTEMVNAEMDDWGYLLHEHDLDDALPQWLVDDMRQRMLHVASAAANGRKSKVESEA